MRESDQAKFRICDGCGAPMTYLSKLPQVGRKPAAFIFRCFGCNRVTSEWYLSLKSPPASNAGRRCGFHAPRRKSRASFIKSTNARNAGARRASSRRS